MNQHQPERREFIKKSIECAICAVFSLIVPPFQANATTKQQRGSIAVNDLMQAIEASDAEAAASLLRDQIVGERDAWKIHLALYPVVFQVLNPPFINPHLPKMYAICRELAPYLKADEIAALVHLEVTEYAKRPKLQKLAKAKLLNLPVAFKDVAAAIESQDREKTTILMATFQARKGGAALARELLLLGSGYLDRTLGHSLSCTAFILLEMLQRADQDPWPALTSLADYFCKGRFHSLPVLSQAATFSDEVIRHHLLRATSGRGIINLHHTITFYALQRVKQFFSPEEYQHLLGAWIAFLQDKKEQPIEPASRGVQAAPDYTRFYKTFSRLEPDSAAEAAVGMLDTRESRRQLGQFLIRGICDQYQGDYNPHNLTGLGSALWVAETFWNQAPIAQNALFQYLDFFFDDLKSKK